MTDCVHHWYLEVAEDAHIGEDGRRHVWARCGNCKEVREFPTSYNLGYSTLVGNQSEAAQRTIDHRKTQ